VRKSTVVLTLVAIPITAFAWSYAYMMAGDCPGLDADDLNSCIARKSNAGYVAVAACALLYGAAVMFLRRRGQR
jgi:hypothetical protein